MNHYYFQTTVLIFSMCCILE